MIARIESVSDVSRYEVADKLELLDIPTMEDQALSHSSTRFESGLVSDWLPVSWVWDQGRNRTCTQRPGQILL